jgi:hypothetical protein
MNERATTNIWALDKDLAIRHLLIMLNERFPEGCFEIGDVVEFPRSAIRLHAPGNPALSVYLYTHGQEEDRYGLHLEYPQLSETPVNNTVEMLENVSLDRLAELLAMHFGVAEQAEHPS